MPQALTCTECGANIITISMMYNDDKGLHLTCNKCMQDSFKMFASSICDNESNTNRKEG